jgi:hypothetical protein
MVEVRDDAHVAEAVAAGGEEGVLSLMTTMQIGKRRSLSSGPSMSTACCCDDPAASANASIAGVDQEEEEPINLRPIQQRERQIRTLLREREQIKNQKSL